MFCPKCGKKNDDKAIFCEQCGEKLNEKDVKVKNNSKTILIICGVCLVGIIIACLFIFKSEYDFQFSKLRLEKGYTVVYLKGKIKNNTGKNCGGVRVEYEYGNGNLMEKGSFYIFDIGKGEILQIDEITDIDADEDFEDYEVVVKKAECTDI